MQEYNDKFITNENQKQFVLQVPKNKSNISILINK